MKKKQNNESISSANIRNGVLVIIISIVALGGCSYLNKKFGLENDNNIEEFVEKVVENQIGLDIDFTPSSIELDIAE